ncbi:hypothetical protein LX32DRAFT_657809 [Colletotrichum zoysiae]|uniref:Uncharacterized protein n=1 Tax=Colletotrichum zoysiae TaxID=1216348 RepID=A0AAD9H6G7_9PEZI|nr:hypothetical protein LX32DRAFT_657809 [Colletotrichum zoysiae]
MMKRINPCVLFTVYTGIISILATDLDYLQLFSRKGGKGFDSSPGTRPEWLAVGGANVQEVTFDTTNPTPTAPRITVTTDQRLGGHTKCGGRVPAGDILNPSRPPTRRIALTY